MKLIQLPAKILPIEKWRAYKGIFPTDSSGEHRIIIIQNTDPLHYFYVTSQVEKCKCINKYDAGSIAEISPTDWSNLSKQSCVQCNLGHLCSIEADELRTRYAAGNLDVLGEVPISVQQKIVKAIESSKTFTEKQKVLLKI